MGHRHQDAEQEKWRTGTYRVLEKNLISIITQITRRRFMKERPHVTMPLLQYTSPLSTIHEQLLVYLLAGRGQGPAKQGNIDVIFFISSFSSPR
jgi:hypothetical protein